MSQTKKKPNSKAKTRSGRRVLKTKRRRKPSSRFSVQDHLPKRALEFDAIRAAATRIDGSDALQDLEGAADTVFKALQQLSEKVQSFEESTRNVAEERLETLWSRLSDTEALRGLSDLPERIGGTATIQLDEILERLGLMRKSIHESELEKLRKRMKAAQKAAATRRKKAATKGKQTG